MTTSYYEEEGVERRTFLRRGEEEDNIITCRGSKEKITSLLQLSIVLLIVFSSI